MKQKKVMSIIDVAARRVGRSSTTLVEIKKPHKMRVAPSGNGRPIPPKIKRIKRPR